MTMAQINGNISIAFRAQRRRGFTVAVGALTILCVAASVVSYRAADWISDQGTALIARYGVKLDAE